MNYKILLLIVTSAFLFLNCNNKNPQKKNLIKAIETEKVQKIGYSLFGGWIGSGYNIVITPDSIHYFYEVMSFEPSEKGKYDTLTSPELWLDLMGKLDLNTFEKIESTPSMQMVDGSDREYFIETNKRRLYFLNGEDGEDFTKLKDFFDTIVMLERECKEKAK